VIEALLLLPGSALTCWLLGALIGRRHARTGRALRALAWLWLLLASTPCLAGMLLRSLQQDPPLAADQPLPQADAIVVLSAESYRGGPEYGGPIAGPMTMQRLRYGAFLHRRSGLPILCSGGRPAKDAPALAEMMAAALKNEHAIDTRWVEARSANTWENAVESAAMLRDAGIRSILLVTSAWHLPRARWCFEQQGLRVLAAPTAFRGPPFESLRSLLPSWQALRDTSYALHEYLGLIYYRLTR
jgi:uncharacterized SAM-binding protein YcdF (DUF218 family)